MRAATPAPDERGFILVGVVMFMLTLTILGLSLFALSSYEAQFFYASASREQSLLDSESGIELVRTVLTTTGRLQDAHLAEGQFGITSAIAYQWRSSLPTDTVSNGFVNWDSTVVIEVAGRTGSEQRAVQMKCAPVAKQNPYRDLITCGLGITASSVNRNVEFQGPIWQRVLNSTDTSWTSAVNWSTGRPMVTMAPPLIQGDAWVDAHLTSAEWLQQNTGYLFDHDYYWLKFLGNATSPGVVSWWRITVQPDDRDKDDPEFGRYDFYSGYGHELDVRVRGTNVWVVDRGACFQREVTVSGYPNASDPCVLVIVAKPNGRDPGYENRGIWFKGGLRVDNPNTKVFLVSEGDVAITFDNDITSNCDARALSIVAGGDVTIAGMPNNNTYRMMHPTSTSSTPSAMDQMADQLLDLGALPPITGGTGITLKQLSWRETTPR